MPHKDELPDLFGRVTLVLAQHATFRDTFVKLRAMCATMRDQDVPPDAELLATLSDFARQLLEHLEVEERPEYFGALVEESPRLREPITGLMLEHRKLRDAVRELFAAIRKPVHATDLASQMSRLLDNLSAHERRETALLQDFFHGNGRDGSS